MGTLTLGPPEISVLIPFRNAAPWLRECLDSIVDQSYPDFEVIGVNDFSEDESVEIFQSYCNRDERFRMFSSRQRGIVSALALAYSHARGRMITRMDADDRMPVHRFKWMRDRLLQCDRHAVITGQVQYFSEQAISPGYLEYQRWLNAVNLQGTHRTAIYRECVLASPNWLTYRETIELVGGFRDLEYPEDYDLVLRWYEKGVEFESLEQLTLFWREHPGRISRNSSQYSQASFFELKVKAFLRMDYRGGPLVIWGKNKKSSLLSKVLNRQQIAFDIQKQEEFAQLEKMENPQLLVAVYPSEEERIKIQEYLRKIGMKEGKDWWWV